MRASYGALVEITAFYAQTLASVPTNSIDFAQPIPREPVMFLHCTNFK